MKFLLCLTVLDFCFVSEMIICFRCLVSVWKYLPFFFFFDFCFVCLWCVGVWVCGGGSCLPDMSSFLFGVGV